VGNSIGVVVLVDWDIGEKTRDGDFSESDTTFIAGKLIQVKKNLELRSSVPLHRRHGPWTFGNCIHLRYQ
jgi:hypothetical protein